MADRYWVTGGTTTAWTDITNWSATSGGARNASAPTATDRVFFDQNATYTVTAAGNVACYSLNVSNGLVTFNLSGLFDCGSTSVAGNKEFTLAAGKVASFTALGYTWFTQTGTILTITTNGVALAGAISATGYSFNITATSTGTVTLGSDLNFSGQHGVVHNYGTLNLNNFSITTSSFNGSNVVSTRTLAFSTSGKLIITGFGGAGSSITTGSPFSVGLSIPTITGTPVVDMTYIGSTALTVTTSTATEAQSISFNFKAGTYALTLTGNFRTADFTGFSGSWNPAAAYTVYGGLTFSSGMTYSSTQTVSFGATTGTYTITTAGKTIDGAVTWGVTSSSATWQLQDNMTCATSNRTTTLTFGTLNLNDKTYTTSAFASNNSNTRSLAFGVGKVVVNGNATATVWTTATVTGLTISGTPLVEFIGGGTAVTKTINTGALSEANAISFYIIETTGTATYTFTAGNVVKNLFINGSQTISNIAIFIYGWFTHYNTNGTTTFTAGANAWTFAATSGTYAVSVLNVTYDFPMTFGSAASTATWQVGTIQLGATRALTVTNGTIDFMNSLANPIFTASSLVVLTGSATLANTGGTVIRIAVPITHTSGTLTLASNLTTTSTTGYTLTAGTLSLSTFTLTTPVFSSANANARTLAFGTGKIVINSTTTSTVWTTATVTNLTVTGTSLVECIGGGAATKTINTGALSEANAISFSFLETTGTATYSISGNFKNIIVNGLQTIANTSFWIYGTFTHLTTNGTTTFTAGANAWTFAATSGSYSIGNIAGFTYDWPWTFGSAASTATWTLGANLTLGATRQLTLATGTFDMNNKIISAAGFTLGVGTPILANTGGPATFTTSLTFTQLVGNTFNLSFPITTSNLFLQSTGGTLSLGTHTLTVGSFNSNFAGNRTINFGTGKIVINNSSGGSIWNTITTTGLTISGTPLVECIGGGTGVTKNINTSGTEAQAISFSLLETTGTVTYGFASSAVFKNLIVNGNQTVTNANLQKLIYGSFTHLTTNGTTTFSSGTGAIVFCATTGNQTITPVSGFTYDFPWTLGLTATTTVWTLGNNLTLGATRALTLVFGSLDCNNNTISANSIVITAGGTFTLSGSLSTTTAITHTSGNLTLGSNLTTTASYTLTAGTLSLGTNTLTTSTFVSNNSNVRGINFGTGQLALTGNAATVFDITTATSFTTSGTVYINSTYTGATGTRTFVTGFTEAQSVGYDVATSGTTGIVISSSATDIVALTGSFEDVNLTGFIGTLSNTARTIYGNLILPTSGGTFTAGAFATIFGSTGSKTITTNGRTLDFPITFNGVGGTWVLQDNLTSGVTRTTTLTAGTLNLNNFTYTTGFFNSSGSTTRTLAFGANPIVLTGSSGTIFDVTNTTNFSTTGNVYINCTYTGSVGTRTIVTGFTENQASDYDINFSGTQGIILSSSATDTIALTGNFRNIDLTGINVSATLSNTARTLYGNLTVPATGGIFTSGTVATTFAVTSLSPIYSTGINITTNGRTLDFPFTFNGSGGIFILQDNLTLGSTRTATLTSGTLNLNNYTFTTGLFSSSGAVARTLAFSTSGQLLLTSSGATIFDVTTATNYSTTGTVYINSNYTGAVGTRTFVTGFTEAQADDGYSIATSGTTGIIISPSATDIVAFTGSFYNVNLTGFTGTLSNTTRTIYGNWTNPASGGTYTAGTLITTFGSSSSQTITTNARTLDFPITFNGTGSWALQTAFTAGSTRVITLTSGTLNLNNYTLTAPGFNTSSSSTRTLAFSTSGQLALNGTGTIFDATTATNFSSTGNVYINAASVSGTKTIVTGFTETQAIAGYSVATSGTSGIILNTADVITLTGGFNDLIFTGFVGTLSNAVRTIYGNLVIPASGGVYTAGTNTTTFGTTSSKTITTNGRLLDLPIIFDGVGGAWTLQNNLVIGASTRVITWNNGTLDLNNKTISTPSSIVINGGATGSFTLLNTGPASYTTSLAVTHTSGNLNVNIPLTFGTYAMNGGSITLSNTLNTGAFTWAAGTITLNSYQLTCPTFTSTSTTARTFAFGTGNLTVTGSGACFNMLGATNQVITGTPNVNITNNTATATSVVPGVVTEAQSMNFIFDSAGVVYALTFLGTASHAARDVNFTSFTGSWAATAACTIYGSFIGPSTMTTSASIMTFGGTGLFGNKTVSTNTSLPFPVNFNGVGSYWSTGTGFTCGATQAITFTNGTLDGVSLNNSISAASFTMTTGTFTLKDIQLSLAFTHTSGTLTVTGSQFYLTGATVALSTYTFTAGILNVNCPMNIGAFSSANLNTRTLAFGSNGSYVGQINIQTTITPVTGTPWNTVGTAGATTGWTTTGTPVIFVNTTSGQTTTIAPGIMTEAQSLSFYFTGNGTLSFLSTASYSARTVDLSQFSGTWSAIAACTIYGSLSLGGTLSESANILTLGGATVGSFNSTKTITTNSRAIKFSIIFSGTASTWIMQDSMTVGATVARSITLVNGTLNMNANQILLGFAGSTMSTNTNSVSIINAHGGVYLPFTITSGTCTIRGPSDNSSPAYFSTNFTLTAGTMTLASNVQVGFQFGFTAGTINLSTFALLLDYSYGASGATTRVINFGTGSYIEVRPATGGTCYTAATIGTFSYTGTSDIRISPNGATSIGVATGAATEAQAMNFTFLGYNYTLSTTGCIFKNITLNAYNNGTPNIWNIGTVTIYGNYLETGCTGYGDRVFAPSVSANILTFAGTSGTKTIDTLGISIRQPVTFNGTCTWQLTNNFYCTNTTTLTAGTLQLNSYNAYLTTFNASGATARTIDFGTSTPGYGSSIVIKGNGTPFTATTTTNLTLSGTYPLVKVAPTAPSGTIIIAGSGTEAQSFSYLFYNGDNSGTYTLNFLGTAGYTAKDVDFSGGFAGTWAATAACTIYGSLRLYDGTLTTSASAITFGATSGTKTIQTNNISIPFPITFNGVGGTFQLINNLTLSTNALTTTHTNGTLDLNGYILTTGLYTTAAGTKNITFNAGTLLISGSGATAFNNAVPAEFTTTAGTGVGYISLNSATAKTFAGGASTYNCTLSQDGAGALTISGSNSFTDIRNTVNPTTITFTAGTTQTVSNWSASGTAGNLLVLNSSTAGTLANISKTSGGTMDYVSVKDIAFQPCSIDGSGALPLLWFGGANSTNLGNNFGITFEAYIANIKTYYISLISVASWVLPNDWDPSNNIIHLIGAGGGGAGSRTSGGLGGGPGGGGGGYTKILNYAYPAGTIIATTIGASGAGGAPNSSGTAGGSTVFGAYSAGGGGAGVYGTGGAGGTGSTYNGGRGGLGSNYAGTGGGSGGGGGAGGPNGTGANGGDNFVTNGGSTGGGGNGGGYVGSTTAGGNGWLNSGGGVGAVAGTLGTGGGGGPTGASAVGKAGGSGFDIYGFIGGGGGGGGNQGGSGGGVGGAGGNYGAGGAGAGLTAGASPPTFNGGAGASGLIVIRYNSISNSSRSFLMFF